MKSEDDSLFTPVATISGKITQVLIEHLKKEKRYTFRVSAKNAAGTSDASAIELYVEPGREVKIVPISKSKVKGETAKVMAIQPLAVSVDLMAVPLEEIIKMPLAKVELETVPDVQISQSLSTANELPLSAVAKIEITPAEKSVLMLSASNVPLKLEPEIRSSTAVAQTDKQFSMSSFSAINYW